MNVPSKTSTDDVRTRYERDGYVIVRHAVDDELIRTAERHLRWTLDQFPDATPEQVHRKPLWRTDPFYLHLARQPGAVRIAREILGPDLALFAAGYIVKEPGHSTAVLWHQDGNYWPLDPMEVCTLWLAISPSTPETGCMRVIPGTQHDTLQPHRANDQTRNLLESELDPDLVDESRAVDLELAPGDVSIHHPHVFHGSNANRSADQWRLNLVIRVIAASTRVTDPDWPGVHMIAGDARPGVNTILADPQWDPTQHAGHPAMPASVAGSMA